MNMSCAIITTIGDISSVVKIENNAFFTNKFSSETPFKWFSRYIFQLDPTLKKQVEHNLLNIRNTVAIGVQLRVGGSNKDTVQFLKNSSFPNVISVLKKCIEENNLTKYVVFVSTDSETWFERMKILYPSLISNTLFKIGHVSRVRQEIKSDDYIKRASLDLYSLSLCRYLITTKRSSFGRYAYALSNAYRHYEVA